MREEFGADQEISDTHNPEASAKLLGICSYFRRYITKFSQKANALIQLTHKDASFIFDESCHKAFECLKEQLTSRPVLAFPDYTKPFHIFMDASKFGRGAALMHEYKTKQNPKPGKGKFSSKKTAKSARLKVDWWDGMMTMRTMSPSPN